MNRFMKHSEVARETVANLVDRFQGSLNLSNPGQFEEIYGDVERKAAGYGIFSQSEGVASTDTTEAPEICAHAYTSTPAGGGLFGKVQIFTDDSVRIDWEFSDRAPKDSLDEGYATVFSF